MIYPNGTCDFQRYFFFLQRLFSDIRKQTTTTAAAATVLKACHQHDREKGIQESCSTGAGGPALSPLAATRGNFIHNGKPQIRDPMEPYFI